MQKVLAVSDEDQKLSIELAGHPDRVEFATDLVIVWSGVSVKTNDHGRPERVPLEEAYEAYRQELSARFGVEISKATAYGILEVANAKVNELKKTFTGGTSSTSSE